MNNKENKQTINPSDEYKVRLQRLKEIIENGIDPYPAKCVKDYDLKELVDNFDSLEKKKLITCGRIRSIRLHGGSCFAHIEDNSGKFQIYIKKDKVGKKQYDFFQDSFDIGDFVEVTGKLFKTKKGEKTLLIDKFKLISKALLPLPEKWHGLKNIDTRYRKRYLDLIANPQVKEIFIKRSKIINFIRDYFNKDGFLEVETPILQNLAGGAIAKPFITHHNALDIDLYLSIAPELYLKRLIIGGFEKVYEIARCFRNEGIDNLHNPEFTQIEFYWAYKDYNDLMEYMEKFMYKLVKTICGSTKVKFNNKEIEFKGPYPKLDFRQAILDACGIDLDKYETAYELKDAMKAKELNIEIEDNWSLGKVQDELYKEFVRPKIIQPTYLINHPATLSPLAKRIEDSPKYVQRFQLIVGGGVELMNAFSELNDPLDQEARFSSQMADKKGGDEEAHAFDEDFIEAIKYGMPPMAGLGLGIDRLVSVLTDNPNIKDVLLFPIMKPVRDEE